MTPRQKAIIQDTWQQIVPIADQAASMFYDRLFEIDPKLRALFMAADMASQRRKLVDALSTVVGALDRVEEIVPDLEDLGRRHVGYGVKNEHYDTVGGALLWTLEKGLADGWTAETQMAWTAAYTMVSGSMRDGAAAGDSARSGLRPGDRAAGPALAVPAVQGSTH